MKTKDNKWLEEKIEDIKKRKRSLRHVQDSAIVKKLKSDLKREYRGAKRSMKNSLKTYIKEEVEKFKNKD